MAFEAGRLEHRCVRRAIAIILAAGSLTPVSVAAAATWSEEVIPPPPNDTAFHSVNVGAGGGRAGAAWLEAPSGETATSNYKLRSSSGMWSGVTTIPEPSGPTIDLGPEGHAAVRGFTSAARRRIDFVEAGGTTGESHIFAEDVGSAAYVFGTRARHQITAINGNGSVASIATDSDDGAPLLLTRFAGTWARETIPFTPGPGEGDLDGPLAVGIDGTGAITVLVGTTPGVTSLYNLHALRRAPNGTWEEPQQLTTDWEGGGFRVVELSVGESGAAAARWMLGTDGKTMAERGSDGIWRNVPAPHANARVTLGTDGRAVAFLADGRFFERPSGGTWSESDPVPLPADDYMSGVTSVDSRGNVVLIEYRSKPEETLNECYDGAGNNDCQQALARHHAPGGGWGEAVPLTDFGRPSSTGVTDLATDPGGLVAVGLAWQRGDAPPRRTVRTLDLSDGVVINVGPEGRTSDRNPSFSWVAAAQDVTFECRLDGNAWTGCQSPKAFDAVPDGSHVFQVRAVRGADTLPAATRAFTVDTTGPTASIDSVEAGSASATVSFSAPEADVASFDCAAGGEFAPCTSPKTFELAPGAHTVRVRAIDDLGNPGPETSRSVTIAGETCPVARTTISRLARCAPVECAAGMYSRVAFGPVVALAEGAVSCFRETSPGLFETGPEGAAVLLNGVRFLMPEGSRLEIAPKVGRVSVVGGARLTVGGTPLSWSLGTVDWSIPVKASTATVAIKNGVTHPVAGNMLLGGALEFALSAAKDGSATVKVAASLPPEITNALSRGKSAIGFDAKGELAADNLTRGAAGALQFTLEPGFLLGPLKLSKAILIYDFAKPKEWSGTVVLKLPGPKSLTMPEPEVALELGMAIDPLRITKMSFLYRKLNAPLGATWIYLQRIGGSMTFTPPLRSPGLDLAGTLEFSLGPHLTVPSFCKAGMKPTDKKCIDSRPILDAPPISVGGTARWKIPGILTNNPHHLGLTNLTGKVLWWDFATGYVNWQSDGRWNFGGTLKWPILFGLVELELKDGWVDYGEFHASASATYNGIFGSHRGAAIASRKGQSACFILGDKLVGYQHRTNQVQGKWMEDSCDLASFAVERTTRASAASRTKVVDVAPGQDLVAFSFAGGNAAPRVTLAGPNGESVKTEQRPGLWHKGRFMGITVPDDDVTYVAVLNPSGGRWRATPMAGSAPISRVEVAKGLPDPKITARVRRLHGKYVLTWRARAIRGQRVKFMEQGRRASQPIKETGKSRGRVRFKPLQTAGRKRKVTAVVTRNGMPRRALQVASFRVISGG